MTNFDKKIADSLNEEYQELLNQHEDLSLMENISATFKGKNRYLVMMTWGFLFFLVGIMILASFKYFNAQLISHQILWAALFMMAFIGQGLIKVWYWMEMHRVANARDLNRIELKIDLLANQLTNSKALPEAISKALKDA